VYELVQSSFSPELIAEYARLVALMHVGDLPFEWADRYHYHLRHAGVQVGEGRFLVDTKDKCGDAPAVAPYLPIAIYLDRLRSAHNVGSIVRTVEAYRLGEVFFSPGMMAPTHPQVVKTAMHSAPHVICHEDALLSALPRPIVAVETCQGAASIYDFTFPHSFSLVFGNEEEGCSEEALSLADAVIRLPLYGCKNSLNVANAFAIVAYEISRQLRF
jgi:tRNA G18 (ribose-2'-O)-methylase SpoU